MVAEQEKDAVFTLKLTAKDDLAADNQASIVSLLPKPVKVLLVSHGNRLLEKALDRRAKLFHGNRLLEKALRACPNVELATATDSTDSAAVFDFVVLDSVAP